MEVEKAVQEIKAGKLVPVDKTDHPCSYWKLSFTPDQLFDNFKRLLSAVIKAKPSGAKELILRPYAFVNHSQALSFTEATVLCHGGKNWAKES